MTKPHALPAMADGLSPEKQVHDERRWAVIVPDEVTKQDVGNVFVEAEGRHGRYSTYGYSNFQAPLQLSVDVSFSVAEVRRKSC